MYPTREQTATLTALTDRGYLPARALVFSGDLYLPAADGTVLRVDPDGREHPAASMPARGVTLALAATRRRLGPR